MDQLFARITRDPLLPGSNPSIAAWYLTDHLGSVRGITDASGTLIDAIVYGAFGNVLSESAPGAGDRYGFTGREYDGMTGLQYNRAREYNTADGRWTSEDPFGFEPGDPNLYRYVANRPTLLIDPSGAAGWDPQDVFYNNLTGAQRDQWFALRMQGWRIVVDDSGGTRPDFNTHNGISVEVTNELLDQVGPGNGVYDHWAVDFQRKIIYIDAYWDSSAADFLIQAMARIAEVSGPPVETIRPRPGSSIQQSMNQTHPGFQHNTGVASGQMAGMAKVGIYANAAILGGGFVNITKSGLSHVLDRHVPGGAQSAGKSLFCAGENVSTLIQNGASVAATLQKGGNLQRIVDAGRIIGCDRVTGQATSIYTIITNKAGDLITAFPGRP